METVIVSKDPYLTEEPAGNRVYDVFEFKLNFGKVVPLVPL